MKTLKDFIDNQAEELLQQSDLIGLAGGTGGTSEEEIIKELNALADCGTTNNCNGGNCAKQCGCGSQSEQALM